MGWSGNARLNARRDDNERDIIETLEARGYSVTQINGKGVPDLLVSKRVGDVGLMWLVEVKQPKGKYSAAQIEWRANFQGPTPHCLRTVEDAMIFPSHALLVPSTRQQEASL